MDQENKNNTGAPSDDTTSALFVSTRKKQLEQQEAERRAREKEEQRLAAEAEVRRLEQEVEERRRKAEEDARRVTAEAEEEAKRIAEEARAKKARAAENPDEVLGVQPEKKEIKLPGFPGSPKAGSTPAAGAPTGGAAAAKTPQNKKLLLIIAAVAVVLVIVIIAVIVGGGGKGGVELDQRYINGQKGFDFLYPSGWIIDDSTQNMVTVRNEELDGTLVIMDVSNAVNSMTAQGYDIISATELIINTSIAGLVELDESFSATPELQKTGDYVTGGVAFEMGGYALSFYIETLENRMIGFLSQVDLVSKTEFDEIMEEIKFSLSVSPAERGAASGTGAGGDDVDPVDDPVDETPWPIDPDATLDAVVDVEALSMGVRYPSGIFYVNDSGDDYVQLATHDPNGALFILQRHSDKVNTVNGSLYSNVIAPDLNTIGTTMLSLYLEPQDDYVLIYEEEFSPAAEVGSSFRYTAIASFSMNGNPMMGILQTRIWSIYDNGKDTGERAYYTALMYYNTEQQSDYEILFLRMLDDVVDA